MKVGHSEERFYDPNWQRPEVVYGDHLISEIVKPGERFAVATMEIPWNLVKDMLPVKPEAVVVVRDMELRTLESLERAVPPVDVVAGIGGGSSHDLAKYIALKKGAKLVQVPTILSADASVTSAIGVREGWRVKYVGHVIIDRILVDFSLIKQAPKELVRYGVCDILSSHTSSYDWELATSRGKERFDQSYYDKAREILAILEKRCFEIRDVSDEGIRTIVELYLGFAEIAEKLQSDRAQEGSEHFFAYNVYISSADYINAAKCFLDCLIESTDPLLKRTSAWYHYLVAHAYHLSYFHYGEKKYKEECLKHLEKAIDIGQTPWFSGLRLCIAKMNNETEDKQLISNVLLNDFKESVIRSWKEFFDHISDKNHNPDRTWSDIKLYLLKGTHGQVADALKTILELMGLETRRLDKKQGEPDVITIGTIGKRFLAIIEIKTKEEKGEIIDTDDVNEAIGYIPMYQRLYPDQTIVPVIFTNKEEFSETVINKATNAVKLIKAKDFDILLTRQYEMMKRFKDVEDIYIKASLMSGIPTPIELFKIFDPTLQFTIELIDNIIKS